MDVVCDFEGGRLSTNKAAALNTDLLVHARGPLPLSRDRHIDPLTHDCHVLGQQTDRRDT